jgi:hypothetical protein
MQRFLLHQKQNQRAVLMVHHMNRDGDLHGTSRREAAVDLMIGLRSPDAGPPGNARFEVHFEKCRRHRSALPLMPLLAELETDSTGRAQWHWGPADSGYVHRAVTLINRGLSTRQVCETLDMSRSGFFRLKKRARALGLLPARPGRP